MGKEDSERSIEERAAAWAKCGEDWDMEAEDAMWAAAIKEHGSLEKAMAAWKAEDRKAQKDKEKASG